MPCLAVVAALHELAEGERQYVHLVAAASELRDDVGREKLGELLFRIIKNVQFFIDIATYHDLNRFCLSLLGLPCHRSKKIL